MTEIEKMLEAEGSMTEAEIIANLDGDITCLAMRLREVEAESDKLLSYAREKLGRRDIHSMYEIVDRLATLEAAARRPCDCCRDGGCSNGCGCKDLLG